ncbi:chitinase [Kutzneria albida]|uniref:chitinase n=1 Tax=Kutzneria albida DSM 43870 TaxID=1449976 RepID=W5VYS8_9PSEU|nr:glycosyl hydrolase family 18 protein [Kutzneria albida]AHH93461.1 Exochitinase 1 [Kutzneria albida DSM 43870]
MARRSLVHLLAGVTVAALVTTGLTAQSATGAPEAPNLAANAGFESGLSGWICSGGAAVSTPVHSGSGAASATPAGQDFAQCSQVVSVQPNSQYSLSAWVQGSYVYLGATGTGTTDPSTWTSAATWTQLSTSFTTGPSTTSVTIYAHGWYGQPAYYLDDVSLTGPGSTPPTTTTTTTTTTPPPTTTTTTTTPTPNQGLPAHALVGYLHASFANGSGYLPIANVPDRWNVIDLAFADSAGNGTVVFNRCGASECAGVESDAAFLAGVKAQQAKGKKVLISIGGANGEVQLTSSAAVTNFVSSVSAIIDKWGLDGVDVDFENQSVKLNAGDSDFKNPTTPIVVNLISALKQLKARYGDKFVLTMAPETFFVQLGYQFYGPGPQGAQDARAGAFLPVIYALRDALTLLTVQDYNSGPIMGLDNQYHQMGGADFHIAMTDMLLTGFPVAGNTNNRFPALRPDQIAIGVPANQNAGNGWIPTAQLDQALDCLTKGSNCGGYVVHGTHPDLRGLMTWSINWDKFTNWEFQNNFSSYFGG